MDAVRTPWQRSEKFIDAPGTPRARSAIAVVAHGVSMEMLRRPSRSHCVYTALIRRVCGVFTACNYLTALLWRLQAVLTAFCRSSGDSIAFARHFDGVHCAPMELLPRPMAFYDKTQKIDKQKDVQILNMTKHTKKTK